MPRGLLENFCACRLFTFSSRAFILSVIRLVNCFSILISWNMGDEITIHGEPPSWSRTAEFVGPRLDFEESLYDDYGLTETSLNFDLDDQVARKTDQLINDMYKKIVSILRRHQAADVKTVKV